MFKRLFIAIVLLGLVVGGIVWFKYFRDDMIAQYLGSMTPAPVPVTATTVEPVTWEPGIEAIGTALSVRGVDLAIESGGTVREILFVANQSVGQGEALVQIDDDAEVASLAAAQAGEQVAQAEANRARTLTERGVGAANTAETAEAQLASAKAQVTQAETALNNKKLVAPFDGEIGIAQIELGQYVTPGTVYATLQDLSKMRVDFSVPEQQIATLSMGGAVTVTSEVGGLTATGRIIAIEPRIDANSRLVSVRAEVENPSGAIYPGQFLRVRVTLPREEGVIAVPQTSVTSSLYGDTIYVIRPGAEKPEEIVVEQVFVQIGRRSGALIEVLSGLEAGDQIVTSGQNRLNPGARVQIDDSVALDAGPADGNLAGDGSAGAEPAAEGAAPATEAPAADDAAAPATPGEAPATEGAPAPAPDGATAPAASE